MNMTKPNIITLIEYQPQILKKADIPEEIGIKLYENYYSKIDVDFPTPKTGNQWKITSKGWVGYIPLTPEWHFQLTPKIPISNLWGMLEYAYDLKSFHWLDGLYNADILSGLYNKLAEFFTKKVLARCRQGIDRLYLNKTEYLTKIRGKIDLKNTITKPWQVKLKCDYQEHTADIENNQILAWSLFIISQSNFCNPSVTNLVNQAYHNLSTFVTLKPFTAAECLNRKYNRLNEDYQQLHALCHLFLDNIGVSHHIGTQQTIPFLINMAKLYENFVTTWLQLNLPSNLELKPQESFNIAENKFIPDLVIYEKNTQKVCYILDTKYKQPSRPSSADMNQIITAATAKNCLQAILVYPINLSSPINHLVGKSQVKLRTLAFRLDGDLELAGKQFLQKLLETDGQDL